MSIPQTLLALVLVLLPPGASAGCSRPIDVPVSPFGLMVTVDRHNQIGGAYIEMLREQGRAQGCEFRFEAVPRARQEMLFLARQSDLLIPAQRTERRDPFGQHVALLQLRPTLTGFKPLPYASAAAALADPNLRVVMLRGIDNGPAYREFAEALRQRNRLTLESDLNGVVRALRTGIADATLMNPALLQGTLLQHPEWRAWAVELQVAPLAEMDWQPSGVYLSRSRLSDADRQTLAALLEAPAAAQSLWASLRRLHQPALALDAGYRPLTR